MYWGDINGAKNQHEDNLHQVGRIVSLPKSTCAHYYALDIRYYYKFIERQSLVELIYIGSNERGLIKNVVLDST